MLTQEHDEWFAIRHNLTQTQEKFLYFLLGIFYVHSIIFYIYIPCTFTVILLSLFTLIVINQIVMKLSILERNKQRLSRFTSCLIFCIFLCSISITVTDIIVFVIAKKIFTSMLLITFPFILFSFIYIVTIVYITRNYPHFKYRLY